MLNWNLVYGSYYRLTTSGRSTNASTWNLDYTYYSNTNILNELGQEQALNTSLYLPMSIADFRVIARVEGGWEKYSDLQMITSLVDMHTSYRGFRFRYGLAENHGFTESFHTKSSIAHLGFVYSFPRTTDFYVLLRGVYLRSDLYYDTINGKFQTIGSQITKRFNKKLQFQFSWLNALHEDNQTFEFRAFWDIDKITGISSLKNKNGNVSATQTMRGSVALDRTNHQIIWDNRQQVGRAGATIRMFIDSNNSGTWDAGEEILPGNALSIEKASTRQVTRSGIARLTQLQPYRRYNFKVNLAKIPDPLLLPKNKSFSVVLDPNSYKTIDVPFFTTGIIDGRVDKFVADVYTPVSGLKIHMVNLETKSETILRTFSDGSYYSMEVAPGDYKLWVDEAQLQFLAMNSMPEKLYFTVESSPEGDFIEGLNFTLE